MLTLAENRARTWQFALSLIVNISGCKQSFLLAQLFIIDHITSFFFHFAPDWWGKGSSVHGGSRPDYWGVEGHPVTQSGWSGAQFVPHWEFIHGATSFILQLNFIKTSLSIVPWRHLLLSALCANIRKTHCWDSWMQKFEEDGYYWSIR